MQKVKSWLTVKGFKFKAWWKDEFFVFGTPMGAFTKKVFRYGYGAYFLLNFCLYMYKGNYDAASMSFLAGIIFVAWMGTQTLLDHSSNLNKEILKSWGESLERWQKLAKLLESELTKTPTAHVEK